MVIKSLLLAITSCGLFVARAFSAAWIEVPAPSGPGSDYVYSVAAVTDSDVWVVGTYYSSGYLTLAEHWDGTSWTTVPTPNVSSISNFLFATTALSTRNVWAVGQELHGPMEQTLVEHWAGQRWRVIPSPNVAGDGVSSYLYAIGAIAPNDIWTVGRSVVGNTDAPLTLHWDGAVWTIVPAPALAGAALYAVEGTATNDVWAAGKVGTLSSMQTLTMHWDGTAWTIVPSPNVGTKGNTLSGLATIVPNDVWAVGHSDDSLAGDTLALHWDGIAWSVVPTPTQDGPSQFESVVAISPTNVCAVGATFLPDKALIENTNGSAWRVVPIPPVSEAHLDSITLSGTGSLWAVGMQNNDDDQLILMKAR
jgi:hypothetical protein